MKQYAMGLKKLSEKKIIKNKLITNISNDSRCIKPGGLFLAVPGLTVDGRDYIDAAIANGAVAVFYEASKNKSIHFSGDQIPILPFSHLAKRQGELAARFYQYPSQEMIVIGVTGTNGKTSVTHFMAATLSLSFPCAVMGTLGFGFLPSLQKNHLTTMDAVTLQKNLAALRDQGANAVAMEVSSHALAQQRVSSIHFDIAMFTQLSRDHLDFHGDMQHYAAAKAKLFADKNLTHRIINCDDLFGRQLIHQYKNTEGLLSYAIQSASMQYQPDIYVKQIKTTRQGYIAKIVTPWGVGDLHSQLLGRFNLSNLLAVLSVLLIFDIPLPEALLRLADLQSVPGRLQQFSGDRKPVVIVDYAHTPDALQKVLLALREHCYGKLWCVFGCGGDRDVGKRAEMGVIAESLSDHVVITNDNPRQESPQKIVDDICQHLKQLSQVKIILDRSAAIQYAVQSAHNDDIVLIAGKGHEDYQILGDKMISFSDAEQVALQLQSRGK